MATFSTHLLNGKDGTHAGHVKVNLVSLLANGTRQAVFNLQTDAGGRLVEVIDEASIDSSLTYELVIETADYWKSQGGEQSTIQTVTDIVFRFQMPEKSARYHMPFIISPNNYSVWWSAPE